MKTETSDEWAAMESKFVSQLRRLANNPELIQLWIKTIGENENRLVIHYKK